LFAVLESPKSHKKDNFETIEELLCEGLSPDAEFSFRYRTKWTLLSRAARYDAINTAKVTPILTEIFMVTCIFGL